jgi:hypothetical protein
VPPLPIHFYDVNKNNFTYSFLYSIRMPQTGIPVTCKVVRFNFYTVKIISLLQDITGVRYGPYHLPTVLCLQWRQITKVFNI